MVNLDSEVLLSLLLKRPPSERQIQANRGNALRSTGPKTEAGKERSALNRSKGGAYGQSVGESMRALGEDPAAFERLYESMLREWRPRTETCRRLVRQLAELMWKLERLGRAERGVAASRIEELERQHELVRLATRLAVSSQPEKDLTTHGLAGLPDSPAKFKEMLTLLRQARQALREGNLKAEFREVLERVYGQRLPGIGAPPLAVEENTGPKHEPLDTSYESSPPISEDIKGLEHSFTQLIEQTETEYALYKRRNSRITPAQRDAQLALEDRTGMLLIRRENALVQQIERTARLLMALTARRRRGPRRRRRIGTSFHLRRRGAVA